MNLPPRLPDGRGRGAWLIRYLNALRDSVEANQPVDTFDSELTRTAIGHSRRQKTSGDTVQSKGSGPAFYA